MQRPKDLLLCTALLVVLVSGCGDNGAAPGRSTTAPEHSASQALHRLKEDLAVFRGAREPADRLPSDLAPPGLLSDFGLEPSSSRFARMLDRDRIYLATGARITCMLSDNHSLGGCWPVRTVAQGLATTTEICPPPDGGDEIVTVGIAPDGVRRVTIHRSNEPDRVVTVVGNVFVAATGSKPPLPERLSWRQDGQRVVHPTGIPSDIAREGCAAFATW